MSKIWENPEEGSLFRDLYMQAINRLRFKSGLWKPVVEDGEKLIQGYTVKDRTLLFVNDVRKLAGREPMSRELFEEGWQYRIPFQESYKHSLDEFWLLCWGDW